MSTNSALANSEIADASVRPIWISWENHRRSRELAAAFGATLHVLTSKQPRAVRYLALTWRTLRLLFEKRPRLVYCQNPSIVLAALLCALRKPLGFVLIVDRHSNFKLATLNSRNPVWLVFHYLSKKTVRVADLTIVTNVALQRLVEQWGGRAAVLPDRLPRMGGGAMQGPERGRRQVVFVCTYSADEPIWEVFKAAEALGADWHIHVTGSYKRFKDRDALLSRKPENVTLTGFVPDAEYESLLASADIVLVLTTHENLLTCGAYEAVSLAKPLVLSDTAAQREYFRIGVEFTKTEGNAIAQALRACGADLESRRADIERLREVLTEEWEGQHRAVCHAIERLAARTI